MGWTSVPTRGGGYAPQESDWDTYIKDNINTGVHVVLGEVELGSDAASIDLSSISQSFAHLMLVGFVRGGDLGSTPFLGIRFNNDSGANYWYQLLQGNASSVQATWNAAAATSIRSRAISNPNGVFNALTCLIPHYTNSTNKKSCLIQQSVGFGVSISGTMEVPLTGGWWDGTAAINRITLITLTGVNFDAGSRFTLMGLPG